MRKVNVDVIFEGVNITSFVRQDILNLSVVDNFSRVDSISLTLKDPELRWMSGWRPKKGERMNIIISGENWDFEHDRKLLSLGPFYIDSLTHSGSPQTVTISGTSIKVGSNVKDEKKNKAWENIDLKSILQEISGNTGLSHFFKSSVVPFFKRVEQNEESDLSFLKRISKNEAIDLKVESDKIVLFNESDLEKRLFMKTIERTNSLNYSITSDDSKTYDSCVVSYFDKDLKESIEGEFSAPQRLGYKENTDRVLRIKSSEYIQGESKEEIKEKLNKRAKNLLRERNKGAVMASISGIRGDFFLYSGAMVLLSGFGEYNGKYMVKTLTRNIGERFTMSLELQREVGY